MRIIRRLSPVVTVLLFAQSCQAKCNNEIVYKTKSSSGSYAAALFARNCDATSGNNLQVSIFRSDVTPDGPGNTFVVDYPDEYYHQGGQPKIKLHWTNDSTLTIDYSPGARIFTQAVLVQGVKVLYVINNSEKAQQQRDRPAKGKLEQ